MSSGESRVAGHPFSDAGLSMFWPGLGQFRQGRVRAGIYFSLETLAVLVPAAALSVSRVVAIGAILLVPCWAMLDAYVISRRAERQNAV